MRRFLTRFAAANAAQIALWERYLTAQRPWESRPASLRWVRAMSGWRLRGNVLPSDDLASADR